MFCLLSSFLYLIQNILYYNILIIQCTLKTLYYVTGTCTCATGPQIHNIYLYSTVCVVYQVPKRNC